MPKKDDVLSKSAFEDTFPDLLRFFFAEADLIFDLNQEIQFLDKELAELFPSLEKSGGGRFVDLLAKVLTLSGQARWILVHVEIQSSHDQAFGRRMFQYFYRIFDRFETPVTALAVFTGRADCGNEHGFCYDFLSTSMRYNFNTYQIFEHTPEQLLNMNNRFALVMMAAQQVADSAKTSVQQLAAQRLFIARAMIESGRYDDDEIHRFMYFLKMFVYIKDKEINRIFDNEIAEITKTKRPMGIIETVEMLIREEGREEGIEEGIVKGREEGMEEGLVKSKRTFIINLLLKTDFAPKKIAALADAELSIVHEIQRELGR